MSVTPPILLNKQYAEPTVFTAENLLREARRQKSLARVHAPRICVLDPDGDIVRWLVRTQGIEREGGWACYHTDLYAFTHEGIRFGIVGCAVGASFAVLVAEELFASGCELLISVTSAGQIFASAIRPISFSSKRLCAMKGPAITIFLLRTSATLRQNCCRCWAMSS